LSAAEVEACASMDRDCIFKVWPLWTEEIKKNPMWR
jgi:hypothetical protein